MRLLRTRFVPVAVDQHIHRRLQDAEGKMFAKVLRQAGRDLDGGAQGVFCFTPDGTLLTFQNVAATEPVLRLLNGALRKFDPAAVATDAPLPADFKLPLPEPPPGGLIVDVTSKVLGGYEGTETRYWQESIGRDHLWIRKDEAAALAQGKFPVSLQQRLACYHLVDNTRGEPPMWEAGEIKQLELTIADGQIRGSVHLETRRGDRGYQAQVLGIIEVKDGQIARLDLVAKGQFWGEGTFTRNSPKGKFPFAVGFRLAASDCAACRVPPQAARLGATEYLR